MARVTKTSNQEPLEPIRPALTEEARESRMISFAMDLAEKQLREGTASSQVITHYLKLGTAQARLELERMKQENELLAAKTEALKSAKRVEELYANAIKAMRSYSGHGSDEVEDDEY